tara:strand:+ start:182 stop:451 length:270 start_codon:yes stop_codon:yes gene_type:complete
MSKVKEMVDLKPKATKITDEQLENLQAVVNDNNAIQFRIGSLETQKHALIHRQSEVQDKIIQLQNTFSEEYGTFDVDLADGTINYPDNG